MRTYTITKNDLDKDGFYIGSEDLTNFNGNVESSGGLGIIKFKGFFIASGYISFGNGDSIEAGYSIEAGGSIKAGDSIEAGGLIKAGDSIEAGGLIKAGDSIEAGYSIEAGLTIVSKTLNAGLRIFAGICTWRIPSELEMEIRTEKLIQGIVTFGKLVIIKPKEQKIETIKVGSLTFDKNEVENALKNLKPIS